MFCGKANFTNLSRYSELNEKTYRRNYAKEVPFEALNLVLIDDVRGADSECIAATDCTFVGKSGKQTEGLDYFYSGSHGKSKRGLEWSLLSIIDVKQNTGYPLSAQQTPAGLSKTEANEVNPADPETIKTRVDIYLEHLRQHRDQLPADIRYIVADAAYSKYKWLEGVRDLNLHAVGKLRYDANLKYFYCGPQKKRGARRKYGSKVDYHNIELEDPTVESFEFITQIDDEIALYSAWVYAVTFKRPIRVVYLHKLTPTKSSYCLLFSTDPDISPLDIYRYYKARFQIEFIFRDAKQFLGLCDCQARDSKKLNFHFNACLLALNVAKVDSMKKQKNDQKIPFSMANYKRRAFNEHLLSSFISRLGLEQTLDKLQDECQDLLNYGLITS